MVSPLCCLSKPNIGKNIWKQELYDLFKCASTHCHDVLIIGNLNCNILQPDQNPDGKDLLDLCDLFDLDSLINEPTRISSTSNNKRRFLTSGTLEPHVSDHLLIYTVMKVSTSFKRSSKITSRSYKNYVKTTFISDLSAVTFHITSIFDDPDDKA